jgi:P27 family predicted phage terminase small subunit
MARGPKSKPIAVLKLQNTFQPVRHAHRQYEPRAEGNLADSKEPWWFTARQRRRWKELLAIAPRGVLRSADRALAAQYIVLLDRFETAARAQNKAKLLTADGHPSPYLRIERQTIELLHKIGAELGLSPISRTRLATGDLPPEEPKGFELIQPRRVA